MLGVRCRGLWVDLGGCLGVNPADWMALWADVTRRYEEDGRHYHTLKHVIAMLDSLAALRDEMQQPHAVELAVWLHDIIYDPHRSDNEAESARYAAARLDPLLPSELVARVSELILATKGHICPPGDGDCALLLDADLAILGAETAVYNQYAQAIRREYMHVPDEVYRVARAEVLRGLGERPFLYHTPHFHPLEPRARQNLVAEIRRLSVNNNQ